MKKIFAMMILISTFSSVAFAAEDEVYVRQEVFDAKMEALFERLHGDILSLKTEIKDDLNNFKNEIRGDMADFKNEIRGDMNEFKNEIRGDMNDFKNEIRGDMNEFKAEIKGDMADLKTEVKTDIAQINGRIDRLEGRIDGIDYKIDVLQTVVYWGLGIFSLLFASFVLAPIVVGIIEKFRQPQVTLADIQRLIEENNVKLQLSLSQKG